MSKHATDFEKIINAGRERKKNEALAARIFSKDGRRSSTPIKAGTGPSLASRVGVKKRVSSAARLPAGDINSEWTHDLHNSRSTPNLRSRTQPQQPRPSSLAARIHAPGTKPAGAPPSSLRASARPNTTKVAKLANALARSTQQVASIAAAAGPAAARGITIRGLAGPYAVLAQNFAPGTTAADIESAMTPVGGLVSTCRLVKTHPLVIAEIVFETKEGADAVIETFNNQTADGRLLHVYMKPGAAYVPGPPTGPRALRAPESRLGGSKVIDGSNGFDDDLMDGTDSGPGTRDSGLYSDRLVSRDNGANGANTGGGRRGRGFNGNNNNRFGGR